MRIWGRITAAGRCLRASGRRRAAGDGSGPHTERRTRKTCRVLRTKGEEATYANIMVRTSTIVAGVRARGAETLPTQAEMVAPAASPKRR